jgi:hypothetical protein
MVVDSRAASGLPTMSRCDHKFIDSTRCLKCGWEAPKKARRVPDETPEQRLARDRYPVPLELQAGVARSVNFRSRYVRAYVLGIKFEAPDLEALEVQGIQMERYEQLAVSPVPAAVFNGLRSLMLPVAHASLGLDLKLFSSVDQTIAVTIQYSECTQGKGLGQ